MISISTGALSANEARQMSCGPNALSVSARLLKRPVTSQRLDGLFEQRANQSLSLRELKQAAHELGFVTRSVRLNPSDPQLVRWPLIVRLSKSESEANEDHFVVLYGKVSGRAQVLDFPIPPQFISAEVLAKFWDGYGLYLATSDEELLFANSNITSQSIWVVTFPVTVLLLSAAWTFILWVRRRRKRTPHPS